MSIAQTKKCLNIIVVAMTTCGSSLLAAEPISPSGHVVLHPFNGRDFTGWTTWLKESGEKDPKNVFDVVDGMIHISGEDRGYLATTDEYRDYHLVVEYKWGDRTDGSKYVRNSGVLLHKIGQDRVWPTSLEVQLAQGCEGDFIVIAGGDKRATITCETRIASDGKTRWQAGGEKVKYSGRQFWWSNHQPGFKELLDTRGKDDVASLLGQWTKVECICRGSRVTIKINGHTVNECFDAFPAAGKVLLQNEGNEIYFRNLELRPLPPAE